MAIRKKLPTDPNQRARAVAEQATGKAEEAPLPGHLTVSGGSVTCSRCGQSFALAKRESERPAEIRAFATIHAHA